VSGGLRSLESAREALKAGAARVVVGTQIWKDEANLDSFVKALGDQLVVALDVKDSRLAVRGWVAYARSPLIKRLNDVNTPTWLVCT